MPSPISFKAMLATTPAIGGRKSDAAYGVLKRAILLRALGPGNLLREQELAREFQCSQGTVREALMRLAEDGLVQRSGYQGTQITDIGHAEAAEMVRVRLSIERAVAKEIARAGIGAADRDALEEMLTRMEAPQTRDELFLASELDRAFHARLATAAGMSLLAPILERCSLHIHRFTLGGPDGPRAGARDSGVGTAHRALLEDLTSGDEVRATAAMAGHLEQILRRSSPALLEAAGETAFTAPDAAAAHAR